MALNSKIKNNSLKYRFRSSFTTSELHDIIHKRNVDKLLFDVKQGLAHKITKLVNKVRYSRKTLLQIRES